MTKGHKSDTKKDQIIIIQMGFKRGGRGTYALYRHCYVSDKSEDPAYATRNATSRPIEQTHVPLIIRHRGGVGGGARLNSDSEQHLHMYLSI